MRCYANDKESSFNSISEKKSQLETCYCMHLSSYMDMIKRHLCGTFGCPFFKPNRGDIRIEDRVRTPGEAELLRKYPTAQEMLNFFNRKFSENDGVIAKELIFGGDRDGEE